MGANVPVGRAEIGMCENSVGWDWMLDSKVAESIARAMVSLS